MGLPWWIELGPRRRRVMKRLVLLTTTFVLTSAAAAWSGEDRKSRGEYRPAEEIKAQLQKKGRHEKK